MFSLLKNKFENVYLFFHNKNYREFLRLLAAYGKRNRNQRESIKFLKYNVVVPDCHSFIFQFKDIFVKNYYLFETTSEEPVIYDCGANIGISCLYFKKLYPRAKIKAFEADPQITRILKKNLEINGFDDIEVINKAVWIDNGGVEFGADGADGGSILSSSNKEFVPSIRLRDILEKHEEIDFLKIDIEGAETSVIPDCDGVLDKVKNIFIEYHSYVGYPQKLGAIIGVLERNKFKYFIKTEENRKSPFINKRNSEFPNFDLQLNIFAYKNY